MLKKYLRICFASLTAILLLFCFENLVILSLNIVPAIDYFSPALIQIIIFYLIIGIIISVILFIFEFKTVNSYYIHNILFIFLSLFLSFNLIKVKRKVYGNIPDYVVQILTIGILVFLIYKLLNKPIRKFLNNKFFKVLITGGTLLYILVILIISFNNQKNVTQKKLQKVKSVNNKKNIVFIVIDTLSAYHLSCYGYHRKTSPFLDRLAEQGLKYEYAITAFPLTGPSHATMFTSLYPAEHGLIKNGWRFFDKNLSVIEILNQNGYNTYGFVSSFLLDTFYGFNQGFNYYADTSKYSWSYLYKNHQFIDYFYSYINKDYQLPAEKTISKVEKLVKNKKIKKPYFLWLHLVDPHSPYEPPKEYVKYFNDDFFFKTEENTENINNYDREIRYTDDQLKRFFGLLEQYNILDDNTLVVITADHGEAFLEHNTTGHGPTLDQEETNIPLIIWSKNKDLIKQQKWLSTSKENIVETIDFAPSFLNFCDIKIPEFYRGSTIYKPTNKKAFEKGFMQTNDNSLIKNIIAATKRKKDENKKFQSYNYFRRAVVYKQNKLIKTYIDKNYNFDKFILYNVKQDPKEKTNFADSKPKTVNKLDRILENEFKKYSNSKTQGVDKNTKKALKSLGYIQ